MPRIARVVAPGVPHHVTQRGNRKQLTFFNEEDYRAYFHLMARLCRRYDVEIWAYCLMPNHVHLIATPAYEAGLRGAMAECHRLYTLRINERNDWRGCLWQGRFFSFPMDERHLVAAAHYIEMNPVRAGLVAQPEDYRWSSAEPHLYGIDDRLVKVSPLLERVGDWQRFLARPTMEAEVEKLRSHQATGRPLGDEAFIDVLEKNTGRELRRKKPGPKPLKPNHAPGS